jgi:hypothetical protein
MNKYTITSSLMKAVYFGATADRKCIESLRVLDVKTISCVEYVRNSKFVNAQIWTNNGMYYSYLGECTKQLDVELNAILNNLKPSLKDE